MTTALCALAQPAQALLDIKKSRFLCQASAVAAPAEALAWLEQIAKTPATHHCWAYRIGQQYRFSDDGEPAGTAGKPILQAIDGQGFDQVMLVVTRWYGGIKLGAGGLIRAYGGVAAECLRQAERTPLVQKSAVEFDLPFAHLALLKARLNEFEADCLDEHFVSDGARLRLALPDPRIESLRLWLADLTRGRSQLKRSD